MLHLFLEKGPWFRAKKYGYGASLPFKWQGWVFLVSHVALLVGLAFWAQGQNNILSIIAMFFAAIAPLPIYKARTEGGWRWRSGGD